MGSGRIATVPNGLTAIRLAMVLVAGVMFFVGDMGGVATTLCVLAGILDILDGWIARRMHQTTRIGAYLDPLADKLLTTLVYGVIAIKTGNNVVWGLFALLLARDVIVTAKRSVSLVSHGRCVSASRMGKIKMAVQSIGGLTILGVLFWLRDGEPIAATPVVFLFGLVTVLSYLSAWKYGVFSLKR